MPNIFNLSIPQLRQWSRHQQPDHRHFNEPVQALNQMTTGIGPPRPPHGLQLPSWRMVVLVEEPDIATDSSLQVRGVQYLDVPPIALSPLQTDLRVLFATDRFWAYPKIGYTIADFVGSSFVDTDAEGQPIFPDLTTVFMEAHLDHSSWVVSPPSSRERFVVCRDYLADDPDGLGRMIIVQEVMPEVREGIWTGSFVVSGSPMEINIWPFMKAADFAPFRWFPAALNDFTTILPLIFWHGAWWLKQRPKRAVSLRRGALQLVDCQPAEEPS